MIKSNINMFLHYVIRTGIDMFSARSYMISN